ncbi:unnamed protein product [Zymoseptoria tritici ST99CH_1A5]|uniref:Uncharacterized protein n=3 Tax=Zymoseptoria tritici TaxID=1047171 RepID=A0A1X7RC85_ZYMT9|nr:unnamed protein product [Zymoseptoria tritici ST99CH_3D7]SMR41395.1 unnamed protein product [Zymoseptoria tritici ST99CH_1E4]SMR43595.1 unnamed protein product [Zymoseptoria tritici ST99CH_3D1]SMY18739.1 unnamed protein product [Zymoseptoria tritici ST99CH_1A5]
MRFPTTLLLLLVCLAALTLAETDERFCRIRRPKAYGAIDTFCRQSRRLIVPSEYAKVGKKDPGSGLARAWITGNCGGGQWIPQRFCRSQFFSMCRGKKQSRKYGDRNCQHWHISYDPLGGAI